MRFLVTGGAGFLGSALSNHLVSLGNEVRVLDDLSSGDASRLDRKVDFTRGDVDDIPLLWSLLRDIDCVYHLAALVSVPQSILHPREYNRVNVGGTVSLMEAMRDTGVGRVIFSSSGAVYGQQQDQPVRETSTPYPDSPYGVSKWAAEQYIHTIGKLWGLETVALRIFNAYGPHQSLPVSHAPVVPRFLQQVLSGGSLIVFDDGRQSRDFVYVDDVVDAMLTAATATGINRSIINLGSGKETSILELVTAIERVTSQRANILPNKRKSGGVPRLVADISLAQQLLHYRPQTDLETGLRLTLERDPRFNH